MRYFLLACFLFLFQSCVNKDKIPANVLSKKKMQSVLWDMLRADEYVVNKAAMDSTLNKKEKGIELYEQVLKIHSITRKEFQKSLDFYQARPDLLKTILDSISSQGKYVMERQYNSRPDSVKMKSKIFEK